MDQYRVLTKNEHCTEPEIYILISTDAHAIEFTLFVIFLETQMSIFRITLQRHTEVKIKPTVFHVLLG